MKKNGQYSSKRLQLDVKIKTKMIKNGQYLIVADVIDGVVNCQNDIFTVQQKFLIIHYVDEIQKCQIFSDKHVY